MKSFAEFEREIGVFNRIWILLALHFLLWFASLKFTTVASSTIILALQPIVSLVGGFFLFKERTTSSAIATMGIAILGVMCIGWGDLGLSEQAVIGDILSFLSVIAVVGYLFIGQTTVKKFHTGFIALPCLHLRGYL